MLLGTTVLVNLLACLPHGALGGSGRQEARAYDLAVADDQGFSCSARLSLHFAEEFQDSSLGWLGCLHAPGTEPVAGQCVELRSFPTGEVLEVRGLAEWPAFARLDLLWPMVSPAIRPGEVLTSWPLFAGPDAPARVLARGVWVRDGPTHAWAATLDDNDPALVLNGAIVARFDVRGGEVERAEWTAERSACVDGDCVQWSTRGTLRAAGVQPALPPEVVSARAAALALRNPGVTGPSGYTGLLRAEDSSPPPGCSTGTPIN